jgi:hypothetical protein
MPSGFPDTELFQSWIAQFFVSSASQLLTPGAILAIALMTIGVGMLAFLVASMSVPTVEAGGDLMSSEPSDWLGSACAWVCPWQPRGSVHGHGLHRAGGV